MKGLTIFLAVFILSICQAERDDRKIDRGTSEGSNNTLPLTTTLDEEAAIANEAKGIEYRTRELFPHEFARRGNSPPSFRQGRSDDDEELESLDDLFPEALKSHSDSYSSKDSEQDYLTFSSVGDVFHENGTSYEDEEFESLDGLEPSALISTTYNVEEVIENLDDLTAGALIANYLFEDDLDSGRPNASKLLEKKLYDLDQLLDGTGVNASVLISAVETLRKAGGLQNLLRATKGANIGLLTGAAHSGAFPPSPLSVGISSLGKVGGAMKHQDMDEIRRELKWMLFGEQAQGKVENRRMDNMRPSQVMQPPQQRIGNFHKKQEQKPAGSQRYNNYQTRDYQAPNRPKPNHPPPPPVPHNKNLDFGGYVRIHLPSIMAQMKGQHKPPPPRNGYQRPGYFRAKASDRNFRPSEELDGKKDISFKPVPPPSRTPPPTYNERGRHTQKSPQRPNEIPSRPQPERFENGPIRTKEIFGSHSEQRLAPDTQRCDTFWENICMEVDIYPAEQIRNNFLKNKLAAETLLADVKRQSADNLVDGIPASEERKYTYNHYYGNRRQGDEAHLHKDFANDGGYICPSDIVYGRPKRAKNSRGDWKYIVNLGDYTQTLRFEKCLKPGGSCSYLAQYFISHCSQVYNYHRLLAWDEKSGLHMDIFKVPTGCSCHIGGHNIPSEPTTLVPPREKKRKVQKYREEDTDLKIARDIQEENYGEFSDLDSFVSQNFGGRFPESRSDNLDTEESKLRTKHTSPSRIGPSVTPTKPDTGRSSDSGEKSKVNYGYHPIIDFFQNYRFTAAR